MTAIHAPDCSISNLGVAKHIVSCLRHYIGDTKRKPFDEAPIPAFLVQKLKMEVTQLKQFDDSKWNKIEEKVNKWVTQISGLYSPTDGSVIRAVTGGYSSALVSISQAFRKKKSEKPCLASPRQLSDWKIASFGSFRAGEARGIHKPQPIIENVRITYCHLAKPSRPKSAFNPDQDLQDIKILLLCIRDTKSSLQSIKELVLKLIHMGADSTILNEAKLHIEKSLKDLEEESSREARTATLENLIGLETDSLFFSPPPNQNSHPLPLPIDTIVGVTRSNGTVTFAQIDKYSEDSKLYGVLLDHDGLGKDVPIDYITTYDQDDLCSYIIEKRSCLQATSDLDHSKPSGAATHAESFTHQNLTKDLTKILEALQGRVPQPESFFGKKIEERTKRVTEIHELQNLIQNILDLFKTENKLELSDLEQSLKNAPFPIVCGSTKKITTHTVNLGSDIRAIFTEKSKIGVVQEWLSAISVDEVAVLTFKNMEFLRFLLRNHFEVFNVRLKYLV